MDIEEAIRLIIAVWLIIWLITFQEIFIFWIIIGASAMNLSSMTLADEPSETGQLYSRASSIRRESRESTTTREPSVNSLALSETSFRGFSESELHENSQQFSRHVQQRLECKNSERASTVKSD